MRNNVYCVLTPRGEGGIGVIRLQGPDAELVLLEAFETVAGKRLEKVPTERLVFGILRDGDSTLDEVMLTRVAVETPEFEIQCHGGHQTVRSITNYLKSRDFAEVSVEEYVGQGHLDAIQMEAELTIPHARSPLALSMLLSQRDGALSDFARELASGNIGIEELENFLAPPHLGQILCNPPRVILAGPPNAGKSSLFNHIVGQNRVIVADVPGTTRDAIVENIVLDGIPLVLVDTAGLRETEHKIESAAIEVSHRELAMADCVLFVFDGTTAPTTEMLSEYQSIQSTKPTVAVLNKCDLETVPMDLDDCVFVSALSGAGINDVHFAILEHVAPDRNYTVGEPAIFNQRQAIVFTQMLTLLRANDLEQLRHSLSELLTSS